MERDKRDQETLKKGDETSDKNNLSQEPQKLFAVQTSCIITS